MIYRYSFNFLLTCILISKTKTCVFSLLLRFSRRASPPFLILPHKILNFFNYCSPKAAVSICLKTACYYPILKLNSGMSRFIPNFSRSNHYAFFEYFECSRKCRFQMIIVRVITVPARFPKYNAGK